MSTVSVTNTFVAATTAVASQVNTNFNDLVTYINTNAITKDAALAFTSIPSGPASDPTTANQFTRKSYVDALVTSKTGLAVYNDLGINGSFGAYDTYPAGAHSTVTSDTLVLGETLYVMAWGAAICQTNASAAFRAQLQCSFNNGTTWSVTGQQSSVGAGGSGAAFEGGANCFLQTSGVVGAGLKIKVRLQVQQRTSFAGLGTISEPHTIMMISRQAIPV